MALPFKSSVGTSLSEKSFELGFNTVTDLIALREEGYHLVLPYSLHFPAIFWPILRNTFQKFWNSVSLKFERPE